jgi:hypothetical protein
MQDWWRGQNGLLPGQPYGVQGGGLRWSCSREGEPLGDRKEAGDRQGQRASHLEGPQRGEPCGGIRPSSAAALRSQGGPRNVEAVRNIPPPSLLKRNIRNPSEIRAAPFRTDRIAVASCRLGTSGIRGDLRWLAVGVVRRSSTAKRLAVPAAYLASTMVPAAPQLQVPAMERAEVVVPQVAGLEDLAG